MIKAIIFDYTGVFTEESSLLDFCDFYSEKNNLDTDQMKELTISLWLEARVSNIESNEFWQQLASYSNKEISKFRNDFINFFGFRNELYNFVVQNLKDNYKLGLLSNQIESWFEPVIKAKKFNAIFDVIVTSYGSKLAKPDKRIFEKIINELKLEPNECIYIDDFTKNILPAKEIGMSTILFKDFEQFKQELNSILSH